MSHADNISANDWSSTDKFAAVMETTTLSQTKIVEYCREKGFFPEQLAQWGQACEQANDWDQASEKKNMK